MVNEDENVSLLESFTIVGEKANAFKFLAQNPDMFLVRFNKWRHCLEIYIDSERLKLNELQDSTNDGLDTVVN